MHLKDGGKKNRWWLLYTKKQTILKKLAYKLYPNTYYIFCSISSPKSHYFRDKSFTYHFVGADFLSTQLKNYATHSSINRGEHPSIRVFALACAKILIYFSIRTYFFYFSFSLFKIFHIRLSILHYILLKYQFF